MPRKVNGWGAPAGKAFAFKPIKPIEKSSPYGAAGNYPSSRMYGTSVTRSVVEKYDMDSDWVKWRKGYEYYMQAAWDELVVVNPFFGVGGRLDPVHPLDPNPGDQYTRAELSSVLYQGTAYELPTLFYGWEFPTQDADTNTHYVAKREPQGNANLGTISEVWNDPIKYKDQKASREIWVKGVPNVNARLLLQMEGERLWDQETEATLKMVLTEDQKPAVYKGKTFPKTTETDGLTLEATTITLTIPVADIEAGTQVAGKEYTIGQGLAKFKATKSADGILDNPANLLGNIIFVPEFFIERSIDDVPGVVWSEVGNPDYFGLVIQDQISANEIYCLDPGVETLPPSMYDISTLPTLFKADNGTLGLSGTYILQRKQYNRFFPNNFVTATQIEEVANELSYAILPYTIASAEIRNGNLIIESVPFSSEIKVYPELTNEAYLVFTDYSFCKYQTEYRDDVTDAPGKAIPGAGIPGTAKRPTGWTNMYLDVQPWQDEVFTTGNPIEPANTYTCSCPNHAHAILAAPQATEDLGTRKQNRQRRYPLPSVQGLDRWQGLGVEQVSGKLSSWETAEHRLGLRLCKHAIAARFIEKIRVIEPSQYPSLETRLKFEEKLREEINKFSYDFRLSYRRSQISLTEIVFALAQGLNLDGIETAYVLFNTY